MKLTMWLTIVDGQTQGMGSGDLYTKTVETSSVPEPGVDEVILWRSLDEDGDEWDGPLWYVKRRYMDSIGCWHIELASIIVDPAEFWQQHFNNSIASGRRIIRESSWYTDRDGDNLLELLSQGGWAEYKSRKGIDK